MNLMCLDSLGRLFQNSFLEELRVTIPRIINPNFLKEKPSSPNTIILASILAAKIAVSADPNPRFKLFNCFRNFIVQDMPFGNIKCVWKT